MNSSAEKASRKWAIAAFAAARRQWLPLPRCCSGLGAPVPDRPRPPVGRCRRPGTCSGRSAEAARHRPPAGDPLPRPRPAEAPRRTRDAKARVPRQPRSWRLPGRPSRPNPPPAPRQRLRPVAGADPGHATPCRSSTSTAPAAARRTWCGWRRSCRRTSGRWWRQAGGDPGTEDGDRNRRLILHYDIAPLVQDLGSPIVFSTISILRMPRGRNRVVGAQLSEHVGPASRRPRLQARQRPFDFADRSHHAAGFTRNRAASSVRGSRPCWGRDRLVPRGSHPSRPDGAAQQLQDLPMECV